MTGQNASTVGIGARQRGRMDTPVPVLNCLQPAIPIYRPIFFFFFQKQTKRKLGIPEAEDFELRFCLYLSGTEKKKHKAKEKNKRKEKEKKGKERKERKEKHE